MGGGVVGEGCLLGEEGDWWEKGVVGSIRFNSCLIVCLFVPKLRYWSMRDVLSLAWLEAVGGVKCICKTSRTVTIIVVSN